MPETLKLCRANAARATETLPLANPPGRIIVTHMFVLTFMLTVVLFALLCIFLTVFILNDMLPLTSLQPEWNLQLAHNREHV